MVKYDYPYIRDRIKINDYVNTFCEESVGDGPVFLLGRIVEHEKDCDLRVESRPLVIIADEYYGNGQMIDARGTFPGGKGGSVTVRCRRSFGARISVSGAQGATGATGPDGTEGVPDTIIEGEWVTVADPWPMETTHEEWSPGQTIPGTPGSPAGIGGRGRAGGNAGTLVFTSMTEDWPSLEAEGGAGGFGGPGGFLGQEQASSGEDGTSGAASAIAYGIVSEDEYLELIRNDLGIYANYWAPFRIAVGDYFYHQYNASVKGRSGFLTLAAGELAAALQFQPDNVEALRLQRQLVGVPEPGVETDEVVWKGGGNNALGLPRDMDLLPRFDYYTHAYTSFGSLALGFLNMGTNWLLGAEGLDAMKGFAAQQLREVTAARDNTRDELEISRTEQRNAVDEVAYAKNRLDAVIREIQTSLPVMHHESFSFGGFFGTVASIGAAVVGIAAAVSTAGASLVALAPSLVALVDSLSDNAEPIVKALIDDAKLKQDEFDEVKKTYEKVGKNADSVVKGGKSIVNFVKLVQSMSARAGSTPDNSRYVALVKQGAELAHNVLLAGNRETLAQQRVDAGQAKLARSEVVVKSVEQLIDDLENRRHTIQQVGLAAIDIAYSKAQALQMLAFRAQRSIEIYTLQNQEQNVFLDAGMISPDDNRAFYEGEMKVGELVNKLMASWGMILDPIKMQLAYISFFDARPVWDTYRRSFKEEPELRALRDTHRFAFRVEATDLPAGRYDTKVKNVLVAFVGATGRSGEISCMVRHGGKYEQRRPDNSINVQQLQPQIVYRRAKTIRLDRPIENSDPPLDAPTSLAIWGRGVGGDWEVMIEPHEFEASPLDLSGLTEIQVWIDYQFIR